MANSELLHYGVLGMKWGVRRSPDQLARARGERPKSDGGIKNSSKGSAKSKSSSSSTKKTSEMTEDELRSKINRLELEKRYKELLKATNPPKSTRGKDFVMRVLEKSGENVLTQLTTDVMGEFVNKTFGKLMNDPKLVNPKKGQKDK